MSSSTEINLTKDSTSPACNAENLTTKPLRSLPTPDTVYTPGALLHLDFSFYDAISLSGFASVLDGICVSTSYVWAFPTRSKRLP